MRRSSNSIAIDGTTAVVVLGVCFCMAAVAITWLVVANLPRQERVYTSFPPVQTAPAPADVDSAEVDAGQSVRHGDLEIKITKAMHGLPNSPARFVVHFDISNVTPPNLLVRPSAIGYTGFTDAALRDDLGYTYAKRSDNGRNGLIEPGRSVSDWIA